MYFFINILSLNNELIILLGTGKMQQIKSSSALNASSEILNLTAKQMISSSTACTVS